MRGRGEQKYRESA